MGLLQVDAVSHLIPFRFFLGDDGMGIRTENIDSFTQAIQVTLCPLGLPMSIS